MRTAFRAVAFLLAAFVLVNGALTASAQQAATYSLVILPREVTLTGPKTSHALLVQQATGSELGRQVTEGIEWTSANPEIAVIEKGIVRPVSNGETTVVATVNQYQ